jgi:hypothetical protein
MESPGEDTGKRLEITTAIERPESMLYARDTEYVSLSHKGTGDHFDHRMCHRFVLRSAHLVSRNPQNPFVQQAHLRTR